MVFNSSEVAAVTTAEVPLKETVFSATIVLKPVPKIVTGIPAAPTVGFTDVMPGGDSELLLLQTD